MQEPSIGRIVHYVLSEGSFKGEHRPAIITQVWQPISNASNPGMSNLTVFPAQSGDFFSSGPQMVGSVLFNELGAEGTWHWPEKY